MRNQKRSSASKVGGCGKAALFVNDLQETGALVQEKIEQLAIVFKSHL